MTTVTTGPHKPPVVPRVLPCGCEVIGTGTKAHPTLDAGGQPRRMCGAGLQAWGVLRRLSGFGADKDLRRQAEADLVTHMQGRAPKATKANSRESSGR